MFVREDWTIFRNINTLTHKAGVPLAEMRSLVLKEIMDNALDAAPGKKPRFGNDDNGFYFIEDDGPGIAGTPEQIAKLFSIRRPLTSSKILRKPSRGALGNGIRVIVGAVMASGGRMNVHTRGQYIGLELHDDGITRVGFVEKSQVKGTRIEIQFGSALPKGRDEWRVARNAAIFNFAKTYEGQSSVWWYDSDSFYELLQAANDKPLHEILPLFDGFAVGTKNYRTLRDGNIVDPKNPTLCGLVSRDQADHILGIMREHAPEISPKKIGRMFDRTDGDGVPYARRFGTLIIEPGRGKHSAKLPYVVECLAGPREQDEIMAMVNGTPITGRMTIERREAGVAIFGCGLHHKFDRVSKKPFLLTMNITIPYMPITTDGKEPDFGRFIGDTLEAMRGATRKLKTTGANEDNTIKQAVVLDNYIDKAIAKASGNGEYRFSLRQLYYALRPYVMEHAANGELDYGYFSRWVGQYENDNGEIKGMYRDPRGTLYHPHTGETIPIGTIAVEEYKRPEWTFNKILYIEKEGLFEVLKQNGFPEKYDCALLSSKGYASRAVRDLIDLLGDDGEEIHVFAIHDADGPGTVIYESLVEGTVARAGRRVKVHNLGLEPWEGMKMGLQVETFEARKQRTPVAKYVRNRYYDGEDGDETDWQEWLQTNRIELNSMTSPQFIEWIEAKFEDIETKKIVPPVDVLQKVLRDNTESRIRQRLVAEAIAKQQVDSKVRAHMQILDTAGKFTQANLDATVERRLEKDPQQRWSVPLEKMADELIAQNKDL